jgi:hypothetical protein
MKSTKINLIKKNHIKNSKTKEKEKEKEKRKQNTMSCYCNP